MNNIIYKIKDGYKLGYALAQGKGMAKMLDTCYRNNWSNDNTAIKVNTVTDRWTIYTIKKI